jgi:hypothetical protein
MKRVGLDTFPRTNGAAGWVIPGKIRFARDGLGHDERAREFAPVVPVLGPRFYPWQSEQSAEDSWRECERHAELLRRIEAVTEDREAEAGVEDRNPPEGGQTDLFGEPLPTDLFGSVVLPAKRRTR